MADKKPILQLSTVVEREIITIDGQEYEIRSQDDLDLPELQLLAKWGPKIVEAFKPDSPDLTSDELDDMADMMNKIISRIINAPDEVIQKLSGFQKVNILNAVFTSPEPEEESSESSSQDLQDSMERVLGNGSPSPGG